MNAKEFGLQSGQELFEGEYRAAMAELREAGYTPWSTENWIDARNGVKSNHPCWNNYIDTDFGIAGTKKKIYLAPHSARLRAVTPHTKLTNYGLPLQEDDVETMQTYDRKDHILDRDLTEKEAHDSQVWLDFADGDTKRLDTYVENTFRFGKNKFGYDIMMGIFIPVDKEPIWRAVVLYRLYGRSLADGNGRLNGNTRFVGVRGSAPAARAKKSSPFREDPRSDLEIFLSEQEISRDELCKAVELYKTVKELKV
jgi:hypothetical protein